MTDPTVRRGETRHRILDAAGRLFRRQGVDGAGVDAVMKEAGLTHGGFYAHFASKEALAAEVAQTLLEQAASRWTAISSTDDPPAALRRIVRAYLHPGQGCPLTTLGNDVARRDAARGAMRNALDGMIAALTRCVPGRRRQRALAALSTMVGAVVLSRLTDDPALSKAFLDAAESSLLRPGGRRINPTASTPPGLARSTDTPM